MYDAIIVGARCAGSPTAMLLARKGYRILLVDKATFPSDTISTHVLWPHGAELMDRWGLLDRLAATGCPPIAQRLIFDVGPFALEGGVVETKAGRGGFCPRRTVLDALLVDAAVEAGVELRQGFTVDRLLWDNGRVSGVVGRTRAGEHIEEHARLVIVLTAHQAARDERAKPMLDFTSQMARLEPPPRHMQQLFAALRGNQEATNRFFAAITGSSPLPAFMSPANLERIMIDAGIEACD